MMVDTASRRMLIWASTLVIGLTIGAAGGTLLGVALARISYDYVVIPLDFTSRGLQLGLLAGAAIGACQMVGRLPLAGWRASAEALALALSLAVLGVAMGMAFGYAAFRWDWMDMSGWTLPNPSRHSLLIGAKQGLDLGTFAGIFGGGWLLLRKRCALR